MSSVEGLSAGLLEGKHLGSLCRSSLYREALIQSVVLSSCFQLNVAVRTTSCMQVVLQERGSRQQPGTAMTTCRRHSAALLCPAALLLLLALPEGLAGLALPIYHTITAA